MGVGLRTFTSRQKSFFLLPPKEEAFQAQSYVSVRPKASHRDPTNCGLRKIVSFSLTLTKFRGWQPRDGVGSAAMGARSLQLSAGS